MDNYRPDLLGKLRDTKDREKQREIVREAKSQPQYAEAREQKIEAAREKKKDIERVREYGRVHYAQYLETYTSATPPEITREMFETRNANWRDFYENVLPNAGQELKDRVAELVDGKPDSELTSLLERVGVNIQMAMKEGDVEKVKQDFLTAILVAQTYERAVEENHGKEISFSGFESDPDIPDLREYVCAAFGKEFLETLLISEVRILNDMVWIRLGPREDYFLPVSAYEEWEKVMPEIKERRAVGGASNINSIEFTRKFVPLPIKFFNIDGMTPGGYRQFRHLPPHELMRRYKLVIITHEIGHHIQQLHLTLEKKKEWKEIVDRTKEPLTRNLERYVGHPNKYEESFADAISLKVTDPEYLKKNSVEMYEFLEKSFPQIKGPDIFPSKK